MNQPSRPTVDLTTVIGLALLLIPLTTMWHEIGGHAFACAVQGGHVAAIGAFYVDCTGLTGWPRIVVSVAGAALDAVLAAFAYLLWRRARGDMTRLVLWYVWVGKGFTAAGYLCFSGVSGFGDLAPGSGGGLGPVAYPVPLRIGELAIGIVLYAWLIRRGTAALTAMVGSGAATGTARRRIAHGYYMTAGIGAVLVGLLNPMGVVITLLSAAASSFGGLAGLISIGFAKPQEGVSQAFAIPRSWPVVIAGIAVTIAFAAVLGPTLNFP